MQVQKDGAKTVSGNGVSFKKKGSCIGMVDEPNRILDIAGLNEQENGNYAKTNGSQIRHKLVLQRTIPLPVHTET